MVQQLWYLKKGDNNPVKDSICNLKLYHHHDTFSSFIVTGNEIVFCGQNCYGLLLGDVFEGVERETLKLPFIHITGPLYGSRLRSASGLPRNRGHGMDSDRVDRINVTNGLV